MEEEREAIDEKWEGAMDVVCMVKGIQIRPVHGRGQGESGNNVCCVNAGTESKVRGYRWWSQRSSLRELGR
jgi:hypothetical protein